MNEQLTINAALGDDYERIGFYLTEAGLEDASGARRFYLQMLENGKFDRVAEYFNVDRETIIKEFGHLWPFSASSAPQAD